MKKKKRKTKQKVKASIQIAKYKRPKEKNAVTQDINQTRIHEGLT